jgi:hypothetical protein
MPTIEELRDDVDDVGWVLATSGADLTVKEIRKLKRYATPAEAAEVLSSLLVVAEYATFRYHGYTHEVTVQAMRRGLMCGQFRQAQAMLDSVAVGGADRG